MFVRLEAKCPGVGLNANLPVTSLEPAALWNIFEHTS